jgi:nitrite reductase/ring-hydroxylating ferredoxin subunit
VSTDYVVAQVGDLPVGSHIVVQAGTREIGVFNVGGRYYALPNTCFHQNGPLCRGEVSGTVQANALTGWKPAWVREGEIIVCPWHTTEFDIATGRCLADPSRRMPTYEVIVEGSEIKVRMP